MCYFITMLLRTDVDDDRLGRCFERQALPRPERRRQAALRGRTVPRDVEVFTACGHCDCDTTLAAQGREVTVEAPTLEAEAWAAALRDVLASGVADRVGFRVVWWGEPDGTGELARQVPLTAHVLVDMRVGDLYEFVA